MPKHLTATARQSISAMLDDAVTSEAIPHVVAVVTDRSSTLYAYSSGAALTDLYEIASMSKAVTTAGILLLQDRGLLAVDDHVAKYMPEAATAQVFETIDVTTGRYTTRAASTPLTLHHLLTHTSGIGYTFCNAQLHALETMGVEMPRTRPTLPLLHDPGSCWTYGGSTAVLGEIIEIVTGERFYDFIARELLMPLGMVDTGYFVSAERLPRLTLTYDRVDGRLVARPRPETHTPFLWADAGLSSTAHDYSRFLQMILNKGEIDGRRILAPASVEAMFSNQIGDAVVATQSCVFDSVALDFPFGAGVDKFSLGFQIEQGSRPGMRANGSGSWGGLFNTHFWVDPANEVAAVFLTQLLPYYDRRCMQTFRAFERAVYAGLADT